MGIRHPARDMVEATIVSTEGDLSGTEEERMFADFAADAKAADKTPTFSVWMLQTDQKTGKPRSSSQGSFLFDAPMDTYATFTEICGYIRDNYGGGHFRVTGKMLVNGVESVRFNKIVHIIEPRRPAPSTTTGSPSEPSQLQMVLVEMRRSQAENQARFDRLLEQMMERREAPVSRPLDLNSIVQMATAAGTILTSLKGIFAPPTTQNNLLETLALIKGVKNITDEISEPRADGADAMTEAIRTFGKPLAVLLASQMAQNKMRANAVSQIPSHVSVEPVASVTASNAPSHTDVKDSTMTQMHNELTTYVGKLLASAAAGWPAKSVAMVVLQEIPDDKFDVIMSTLEDPTIVEQICGQMPQALPYREWLNEFRRQMLALTEEDTAEDHRQRSMDLGPPGVSETDSE